MNSLNLNPIVKAYHQYKKIFITSLITATILLATLAWNTVIQAISDKYFMSIDKNTIHGKIYYAIFITVVVVMLQLYVFPYITSLSSS